MQECDYKYAFHTKKWREIQHAQQAKQRAGARAWCLVDGVNTLCSSKRAGAAVAEYSASAAVSAARQRRASTTAGRLMSMPTARPDLPT